MTMRLEYLSAMALTQLNGAASTGLSGAGGSRGVALTDGGPDRLHAAPHHRRRDIQGLRAVAVTLVVLDHVTGRPAGGFVGVDVFFVISGYLITGLLLRDVGPQRRRGEVVRSLVRFYWRRVTRLLPAALVVTAATLVGAHMLFGSSRFSDTFHDAIWASGFAANVRMAAVGTDYFASERPTSPLQHYWSLSVEEQFYLVWPLLLLAVSTALVPVVRRRAGRAVIVLPVTLSAVSFAWALHAVDMSATAAYFSTPARAWELGVGAVVACLSPWLPSGRRVAAALSFSGVVAVVLSAFLVTSSSGLPAPGALLPCLGAALCCAAVGRGDGAANALLTNRAATYVGDISYSVYLVHLPIIVLLSSRLPPHARTTVVAALVMTAGSAALLHHVVEKPVTALGRRTSWREPTALSCADRRLVRRTSSRNALTAVAVVLVGIATLSLGAGTPAARAARYDVVQAAMHKGPTPTATGPAGAAVTTAVRTALTARTWPTLTPSVSAETARSQVPPDMIRCGLVRLSPRSACTFGPADAKHTMVVVGDSTAMAYAAGYRDMLAALPGWNVRVAAAYGCAFTSVVLRNSDASVVAGCAAHTTATIREIDETHPDLVLVTNTYTNRTLTSGATITEARWEQALDRTLGELPRDTRVAVVEPAPLVLDPYECFRGGSVPLDCAAQIPVAHQSRAAGEKRLAAAHHWTFVATESLFCDPTSGYCPLFAAGVPIRRDALHVTYAYDAVIAPAMLEALKAAEVLA